jgi:hypothetical protein
MLRSPSFFRHTTRLAVLLPFAVLGVACGDDATSGTTRDGGPGSEAGSEGGPGLDGGPGNDGAVVTADVTAPTVLSTFPDGAASGVSTASEITATFSEAMAAQTLTSGATFSVALGVAPVSGTVTYYENTASFAPDAELALDTTYTATISTVATDVAGNALAVKHSWTFKTDATAPVGPAPVLLGAAGKYVILAKSAITNVPTSAVTGSVALSPAAASYITGFGMTKAGTRWTTPQVIGSVFAADNDAPTPSNLTTAVGSMETAYTNAAGRPTPTFLNLDGGALGGSPLTPGLYKWTSTVTIPANVVISGGANDVWIFQISGDLTMSANKGMTLSGGARAKNVFWQVAGLVDVGTGSHAEGVVLSKTAIKLGAGASINGRLLAQTAVNIASSTIKAPAP